MHGLFCFRILYMRKHLAAVLAFFCFLVSACSTFSSERRVKADEVALAAGFGKILITTNPFVLTAYVRLSKPGQPVHIYIEGDGYAWVTPTRISGDPTPRDPMMLSLAGKDRAANVIY